MKTRTILLAALAGLGACAGELPDEGPPTASAVAFGTWTIGHSELANDCGSEGKLFPVAPARVAIEEGDGTIVIHSPGDEPRTYTVDGSRWLRERHEEVDGCSLSLSETWHMHGINQSHLSATYEAALDLEGECDFPMLHSCRVRYAVWGGRR